MTGCKFSSRKALLFDLNVKTLVHRLKQDVGDSFRKHRLRLVYKPMQDVYDEQKFVLGCPVHSLVAAEHAVATHFSQSCTMCEDNRSYCTRCKGLLSILEVKLHLCFQARMSDES